jgi:hypothetical protein
MKSGGLVAGKPTYKRGVCVCVCARALRNCVLKELDLVFIAVKEETHYPEKEPP